MYQQIIFQNKKQAVFLLLPIEFELISTRNVHPLLSFSSNYSCILNVSFPSPLNDVSLALLFGLRLWSAG